MRVDAGWVGEVWGLSGVKIGDRLGDNEVYAVETGSGRFIVKVAGSWTTRERIEHTTALMEFLGARGCLWAPRLVPTAAGRAFHEHEGRFVYLMRREVGSAAPESTESYRLFGALLAKVTLTTGVPGGRPMGFELKRASMLKAADAYPFGGEYAALVTAQPAWDELVLPIALVHPDLHLNQVLVRPDGSWVIIDWDDAGIGLRVSALGYPLILAFVSESLEIRRAEGAAFYAAYESCMPITRMERRYLFDAALVPALGFIRTTPDRDLLWKRIQFAVAHRDALLALLPPGMPPG